MKIVFLDASTLGDDIDYSQFEQLGEVVRYPFTSSEEAPARVTDADVLVVNKVLINEQTISGAEKLKLVCVTATGTNNLDKDYLARRGIEWRNVAGYSTESVAQHTFAMLFYLMENLRYYDDYVKTGGYINDRIFTHFSRTFHELKGMTWESSDWARSAAAWLILPDCLEQGSSTTPLPELPHRKGIAG